MKDIRLIIKPKNNILCKIREELGFCQSEMARYVGVDASIYGEIENFKRKPYARGGWSVAALKIAKKLKMLPEDIFPKAIRELSDAKTTIRELSSKQFLELDYMSEHSQNLSTSFDKAIEYKDCFNKLNVLSCLNKRSKEIIEKRFGLKDGKEKQYNEIGEELGVSRTRVEQIVKIGLKKMYICKKGKAKEIFDGVENI